MVLIGFKMINFEKVDICFVNRVSYGSVIFMLLYMYY